MTDKTRLLEELRRALEGDEQNALTVADLMRLYAPAAKANKDWQTALLRCAHVTRLMGHERVMGLKASTVAAYRLARAAEKSQSPATRGKPVAVATINREVATLKRACTWAAEETQSLIPHSPVARLKQAREDNVREVVYADRDIDRMVEAAPRIGKAGLVLRALILLLRDSGMRIAEARTLEVSQIDVDTRSIHLRARATKTKRSRVTRVSERALDAIEAINWPGKRYVFESTIRRAPHGYKYLAKKFNQLIKALSIVGPNGEKPHRHDLRRTFTTMARRHGLAEGVIMAMTGHRTRKTFDRYSIVGGEDVASAHRVLDRHERRDRPVKTRDRVPLRRDK